MKKLLFFLSLLITSSGVFAQHRSEQEAMQIAQEFFNKNLRKKSPRVKVVQNTLAKRTAVHRAAQSSKGFYVVNDEANNRFVIVSADERMYDILGYSDNGVFNEEKAPEGLLDIFEWYNRSYTILSQSGNDVVYNSKRARVTPIDNLIPSKWGQGDPYNAECPLDTKGKVSAAGCVATAMAQVMNYYKYPAKGQGGTVSYKTTALGSRQSIDFDALTFNWGNITNEYGAYSTADEKSEVAKLMHACGVSVFMEYNTSSGANPGTIPYAMINNFGYNKNTQYVLKDYYSKEEWTSMIMTELSAKRPILYGGQGSLGGHRFILDGVDSDGLFHFNFGWKGDCDGYFSVDAINPESGIDFMGTYISLNKYDFNNGQGMVIGIYPETMGEAQDVFYTKELKIDTVVNVDQTTNITYQPYCCSNQTSDMQYFHGVLGVGVFDKDWNFVKSLTSRTTNFYAGSWVESTRTFNFQYDTSTFTEGSQYYIALYAKHTNSINPTRVRTLGGEKDWYRASVTNGKVYLARKDTIVPIIPPIPPIDSVKKIVTGSYDVAALNSYKEHASWSVNVLCIDSLKGEYAFVNIDTALIAKGVRPEECKVVGIVNSEGDIQIPNQQIVGNYWFNNFLPTGDVNVTVLRESNRMEITGAWGVIDKSNNATVSIYSDTHLVYSTPKPVPTPVIYVDHEGNMTISCEDSEIYYTLDGTEPSRQSTKYDGNVKLNGNVTVKAIAYKGATPSEIITYTVDVFMVTKPKISANGNTISIDYQNGAKVYYTTNGNKPNKTNGIEYAGSFTLNETAMIMAIAVRDNWHDSEIDTMYHVVIPVPDVVIENNVAGELRNQISEEKKSSVTSLTVSGQLNGSDILLIRDMSTNGKLAHLDIKNASIAEGGEAYYTPSYGDPLLTENNIIGKNMFYRCDKLVSIKLPETATEIREFSFWNCDSLKIIELPKMLTVIKDNVFYSCGSIETINIPSLVKQVGQDNFSNCKSFREFTVDENNKHFKAIEGVLYEGSDTLSKYPMGKVGKSFAIPNNVTVINANAFNYAQFENITFPSNLRVIEKSAFANCRNLQNLIMPNTVEEIGYMALWGCKNLASVVLSSKLKKIGSNMFYGCTSMREFNIGPNISEIADDAFDNCSALQAYTVDESNNWYAAVDGICYSKDMKVLKACPQALYSDVLQIPEGVEELANHAFRGCKNIKNFKMPNSLLRIGSSSFIDCGMTTIAIPDGVKNIDYMAFWGCKNLKTFVFPENVQTIETNLLYSCENIEYIYLPADIKEIKDGAFQNCKSLATINSKIKKIENLKVNYSTYQSKYTSFENVPDTCTWYVPSGPINNLNKYVDVYKAQPWWIPSWRIVRDAVPEIEDYADITLSSDFQTYCSDKDLDFTGVEGLRAYIASGVDPKTNDVILSHVNIVPAKTGILLIGKAGQNYEVPFADADFIYSNLFRGLLEDVEVTSGYVLDADRKEFVAVDGTVTVKGGEAYLNVEPVANASRLTIRFTDTITISGIDDILLDATATSGAWYTLQGVRMNGKPGKPGIYVHQGRKVVVK